MRSPNATKCGEGKKTHAQASRPINTFQHRAGRAFAIGARDVDEAESILGIAGQRGQLESIRQSELGSEPAQVVEGIGWRPEVGQILTTADYGSGHGQRRLKPLNSGLRADAALL